ncbi:MAG: hypothetical protein FWE64_03390 [Alphaproteobacteria bacterium]|nr:hypothetical protein [Alphaproteobacteria bacterium]
MTTNTPYVSPDQCPLEFFEAHQDKMTAEEIQMFKNFLTGTVKCHAIRKKNSFGDCSLNDHYPVLGNCWKNVPIVIDAKRVMSR